MQLDIRGELLFSEITCSGFSQVLCILIQHSQWPFFKKPKTKITLYPLLDSPLSRHNFMSGCFFTCAKSPEKWPLFCCLQQTELENDNQLLYIFPQDNEYVRPKQAPNWVYLASREFCAKKSVETFCLKLPSTRRWVIQVFPVQF